MDGPPVGGEDSGVLFVLPKLLSRILSTPYRPDPTLCSFASRAQTQENSKVQVTVAVLDAVEAARLFGVHLARRGIQNVHLRLVNSLDQPINQLQVSIVLN